MELLTNIFISIFMVVLTTMIYYEILRKCWLILPRLKIAPRKKIIFIILTIFLGHTIAVWIYGSAYWFICEFEHLGSLGELEAIAGEKKINFLSYIYFSATTYSSLGFGDVVPRGALRFLSGVEVLNGLVLIGWSVSFTYLAMEKFWDMHSKK